MIFQEYSNSAKQKLYAIGHETAEMALGGVSCPDFSEKCSFRATKRLSTPKLPFRVHSVDWG